MIDPTKYTVNDCRRAVESGEVLYSPDMLKSMLGAVLYELDKAQSFQERVERWTQVCFTPEICADKMERTHRFFEELTELAQACGMPYAHAVQLVDYVYQRPTGDMRQEVGGVMVTLAGICLANGVDMGELGNTELARVWGKIDQIRAKQARKPKHSPLPE